MVCCRCQKNIVECLTVDKEKKETRTARTELQPSPSISLPSSVLVQKYEHFYKQPDDTRRATDNSNSYGLYSNETGSKTAAFSAGFQKTSTPAGSQPPVEQIIQDRSANIDVDRVPTSSRATGSELIDWKARAKEEEERRLREKEEQLRILQVSLVI